MRNHQDAENNEPSPVFASHEGWGGLVNIGGMG